MEKVPFTINGLENLDKRQGWRGPIDNVDLSDLKDDSITKYLQKIQLNLPKNRYAAIVTQVNEDFIKILLVGYHKLSFSNLTSIK